VWIVYNKPVSCKMQILRQRWDSQAQLNKLNKSRSVSQS
jgi:hypothetical protein